MAAILERNGKYYAQFYDEARSPNRKRFSLKTTRKRKARRRTTKFESDYLEGKFDPWVDDPWSYDQEKYDPVGIQVAMDLFLKRKREANRTNNTIRTYREVIGLLIDEVGASTLLGQISTGQLRDFVRDSSLAKATQRKRYGHLRTFLRWCTAEKLVRKNQLGDVSQPEKPNKLPKAIFQDELTRLCEVVKKGYRRKRKKNWIRKRELIWRIPLFRFAFYTGMRGSELARLRWNHIDFEKELIYIREQKNRKEQTIPLNRKARAVLGNVKQERSTGYVFQSPNFEDGERNPKWFRENAANAFRRAREEAGLREELSFHSLRHGFCTKLAEAGKSAVVIKEAARHADISTSMRYVHMANEQLKVEVEDAF